jgi:hypothetical protein
LVLFVGGSPLTKCIANIAIEEFIQREKMKNREDRVSIGKGVSLLPISVQGIFGQNFSRTNYNFLPFFAQGSFG